jgi:hypothetical protein
MAPRSVLRNASTVQARTLSVCTFSNVPRVSLSATQFFRLPLTSETESHNHQWLQAEKIVEGTSPLCGVEQKPKKKTPLP